MEANYSKTVSIEHRKKFAQFFTPEIIAKIMCKWLLGNSELKTVLEPAFGLGIFSRILLNEKSSVRIKGFDVDDVIFEQAQKIFSGEKRVNLILDDYMNNDWGNKYDGIICNPPYFKFHDYDNKNAIREMERKLQIKVKGFANLYTLFLLKSLYQLNDNGRCAYIIPSEFLNSDYGTKVKDYLIKTGTLRHIIVFDFQEKVFDDALTTSSIILCANDTANDKVRFTNIKSLSDIGYIENLIDEYPKMQAQTYKIEELIPEVKWKIYYQRQNSADFTNLVPFSTYAKVVRGIATGSNDFFTFNSSKARKFSINEKYLLPCICHSVDVEDCVFDASDFEKLREQDKKVYLLNAVNATDKNVVDYLLKGEQERVNKRFITAKRNPWYALEKRPPAPIWVSVFNRYGLKFVRNYANISNLTTFHCIYPHNSLFSDVSVNMLFAYLLTPVAHQIFDDNSREYGNGLKKFEPNDLNKGKILDFEKLSSNAKQKISELSTFEKNDNFSINIEEINHILLEEFSI